MSAGRTLRGSSQLVQHRLIGTAPHGSRSTTTEYLLSQANCSAAERLMGSLLNFRVRTRRGAVKISSGLLLNRDLESLDRKVYFKLLVVTLYLLSYFDLRGRIRRRWQWQLQEQLFIAVHAFTIARSRLATTGPDGFITALTISVGRWAGLEPARREPGYSRKCDNTEQGRIPHFQTSIRLSGTST